MVLIAIGGAEDRIGERSVLKRVLAEAKGEASHVHVITTATGYPEEVGETYQNAFDDLSASCTISHITNKDEANDPEFLEQIKQADVVFFSGGDQRRLANAFNDTEFLDILKDSDIVIAGTSAGAAIMSELMVAGGHPEDAHIKGEIKSDRGFGLADDIIFDTHFLQRDRLPRLFNLVAGAPEKTGIGLDEDTGIILKDDGSLEAFGSNAVTIVDGSSLTSSNYDAVDDGQEFEATGFQVTTLKHGNTHKLR